MGAVLRAGTPVDTTALMSMSPPVSPPEAHSDRQLSEILMRRQAVLSLRVAAVFLVLILGLPLLTWLAPQWSQAPVLGFPLSWFLLGILFYPLSWALSVYFVKASERMEREEAALIREERAAR